MEASAMQRSTDSKLAGHPIYDEVRHILTNPDAALAAGPTAVRLAWFIRANANGVKLAQRNVGGMPDGAA